MHNHNEKEQKLKQQLQEILKQQDLSVHRELIKSMSAELDINMLECAAALSFMNQPELVFKDLQLAQNKTDNSDKNQFKQERSNNIKLVKYRLSVGRKHKVSLEQIKNILVEVSGVERKSIGRLEIRNHYSLVDLPDGMPADVFQLLAETEIQQQKLNIKRIKYQRRFYRRNNKKNQQA